MAFRLLAVDLDGTSVRPDGSIGDADLASIAALQRTGVPVTIITGRLYSGTREVACRMGIRGPVGCVDGSHIVHTQGDHPLVSETIRGSAAERLLDLVPRTSARFAFWQDRILHDEAGTHYAPYVRTWSGVVEVVDDVGTHACWTHESGLSALVAVGAPAAIERAAADIAAGVETARVNAFTVSRFASTAAMVVRARGTDKGTALDWIAHFHGCTATETVVVGDWLNDLPMLRRAGRSFAMGHAPDAVKEAATDQLESQSPGDGVAEAVRRAFGI